MNMFCRLCWSFVILFCCGFADLLGESVPRSRSFENIKPPNPSQPSQVKSVVVSEERNQTSPSPRISDPEVPSVEQQTMDEALKFAQEKNINLQAIEDALPKKQTDDFPTTVDDLAMIEFKLTEEGKKTAAIGYILEDMSISISNRSQFTREQIIFGLPKVVNKHKTIIRRCPYNMSMTCENVEFRSLDGLCNNVQNPYWGTTNSPYSRFFPNSYSDAIQRIRTNANGSSLPGPRFISSSVNWQLPGVHSHITQILSVWTQFIEHDLAHTAFYFGSNEKPLNCCNSLLKDHPECLPIEVDASDTFYDESVSQCMNYVRSAVAPKIGCVMGPRDQMNQASHFLDASTIYGSNEQDASRLREHSGGRLSMTDFENGKSLLPGNESNTNCRMPSPSDSGSYCFESGNPRVNENMPVNVMYTLFAREHNRLADEMAKLNSHWNDELLFQTARKLVVAEIQHITFNELLPLLLGRDGVVKHDIESVSHGFYKGYSIDVNPAITNEFATAAFKFWHTLFDNRTQFIDGRGRTSWKPINAQWFFPYDLYYAGVLDGILRGLIVQPTRSGDQSISSALTTDWLRSTTSNGLDLPALTIQRGRDHGLPSYNVFRDACGLQKAKTFTDFRDSISDGNIKILQAVYNSVDDVDLYTGGLCESPLPGALVGHVFSCIIGGQFRNIRRGDRFWYESEIPDTSFSLAQLNEVRKVTLAQIICLNGDSISTSQPWVMIQPDALLNAQISCETITNSSLDLTIWQEVAPFEPELSREALMNVIEKARELVALQSIADLSRAVQAGKSRVPFNIPTDSVRLLQMEASAFMQGTKTFLKRELISGKSFNLTSTMTRIEKFNALVKSKLAQVPENASCIERLVPCDHTTKFRTISGWCNNLNHPSWGSSERIYSRVLDTSYSDGVDEPRNMSVLGKPLPSPREVQVAVVLDMNRPHIRYTHLLMSFGQFLDHDITLTPVATAFNGFNFNCRRCDAETAVSSNCRPIPIGLNDTSMTPFINETTGEKRCLPFIRSASGRTAFGAREQINQITAFIDASSIYGSSICRTRRLRTFSDGLLNSTKHPQGLKDLLPTSADRNDVEVLECQSTVPGNLCFLAGDTRENENPGLASMHTIWMRFHNRISTSLKSVNPHWNDERLFQESRRILIAVNQHIVFNEYLPRVLGQNVMNAAYLNLKKSGYYSDYDENCDATISNEFAGGAFRFGHTLVQGQFGRYSSNEQDPQKVVKLNLFEHFARSDVLYEPFGIDQLLNGLVIDHMQNADNFVTKALTDHLFEDRNRKFSGQDLVSINIMRGRDHGLPGYNWFRSYCNLTKADNFSDLMFSMPPEVINNLQNVYEHVDDIDFYIAGIAEYPVYGGVVGPTFACIISEQFYRTRNCDRFWYETADPILRFSEEQLMNIRKMTVSKVLCEHSDSINRIQRSGFDQMDPYMNPYVACNAIPGLDLTLWQDSESCNVSGAAIELGKSLNVSPCNSCTCTKEGPFCQSVAVRNCKNLSKTFPVEAVVKDSLCMVQCSSQLNLSRDQLADFNATIVLSEPFAPFH